MRTPRGSMTDIRVPAVLACALMLSGCGNQIGDITVEGRTGLVRSATGDVLIRVQPCGLPLEVVSVAGPMPQTDKPQPNPLYLKLHDPNGRSEPFTVDPHDLESSWVVEINEELPTHRDALIIVNSRIEGQNTQTPQVSARIKDIRALKSGEILVGSISSNSRIIDEEEFLACR